MESLCHGVCLYWDIRSNSSYYYDYLDLRCYISWIFFQYIRCQKLCSVPSGGKKTQPSKSAKIPLRNETKVICSLQSLLTHFFLVLPEVESISASSIEWQHLWETIMSGQRLGLFLTKHHQYKHEDFLRADSQYLCKRRAMNKSFAIIYISNILENHKP